MKQKKIDESNFFYRLVKVAYVVSFLLFGIFVVFLGWVYKPYQSLDEDKTSISCEPNSKVFNYAKIDDYINKLSYEDRKGVSSKEDKAQFICELTIEQSVLKYSERKDLVWSESDKNWFPNNQENRKILVTNVKNEFPNGIYKINETNKTNGSWSTVFLWWILGFVILYFTLNPIRETLLYVVLGKKISWEWLQQLWEILNSK